MGGVENIVSEATVKRTLHPESREVFGSKAGDWISWFAAASMVGAQAFIAVNGAVVVDCKLTRVRSSVHGQAGVMLCYVDYYVCSI